MRDFVARFFFSNSVSLRKIVSLQFAAAALVALGACADRVQLSPLQSSLLTPGVTNLPTVTPAGTATRAASPTVGPAATANIAATNTATAATVTALAAPPTKVATQTPVPNRQVRGAGPGDGLATEAPKVISSTGVRVVSASAQVLRKGPATVTIQAKPGATCTLATIDANGGALVTPARVVPQSVAADGGAAWIWVVDQATPIGALRVHIDCGSAGTTTVELQVES